MKIKARGKKKTKAAKNFVVVGPERKGKVRGRVFGVYKDGKLTNTIEVDHVKESPPGKGESYIAQKDRGKLLLFKDKAAVGRRFPSISPKLPKLR